MSAAKVKQQQIAILMLNMGGPSKLEEVGPFLNRLFCDTDIMKLPFQRYAWCTVSRLHLPDLLFLSPANWDPTLPSEGRRPFKRNTARSAAVRRFSSGPICRARNSWRNSIEPVQTMAVFGITSAFATLIRWPKTRSPRSTSKRVCKFKRTLANLLFPHCGDFLAGMAFDAWSRSHSIRSTAAARRAAVWTRSPRSWPTVQRPAATFDGPSSTAGRPTRVWCRRSRSRSKVNSPNSNSRTMWCCYFRHIRYHSRWESIKQ